MGDEARGFEAECDPDDHRRWRQGDVVEGLIDFVKKSIDPAGDGLVDETVRKRGAVIITQTCDIVRDVDKVPHIQVAPLVELPEGEARSARRGERPTYVHVPGYGKSAFADLDLIMTVAKPALARFGRVRGCRNEDERFRFGQGVARRWGRFAFPNDVVDALRPLRTRLDKKADKGTPEGEAIRLLDSVFVSVDPDWEKEDGAVTLHFVVPDDVAESEIRDMRKQAESWMELVPKGLRAFDASVERLSEVSATEYLAWQRLDYDFVSP
jgi:hypothetical protein